MFLKNILQLFAVHLHGQKTIRVWNMSFVTSTVIWALNLFLIPLYLAPENLNSLIRNHLRKVQHDTGLYGFVSFQVIQMCNLAT